MRGAIAYGLLGDRLYLPVDATLDPAVSDNELSTILKHDLQVLHPSIGLVGFSSGDALRISHLLLRPRVRGDRWDHATAGKTTAPRLLAVQSDAPEPTEFLDAGREDIGSKAPEPPAKPGRSPVKEAISKVNHPLLNVLNWMGRQVPKNMPRPAWVDALSHWAQAQMRSVDDALSAARFAELRRLMEMMEANPEEGLRFAIPLATKASRGIAPPSGKLDERKADFDLSRLRQSGARDSWEVPWEIRSKLLLQYRNAANRELALGRHRRAAYIFAELLGDYAAAANALRQGKHYREAATLYRENLGNLRAAAECLEEGGQLVEAAELNETLKLWVKAGDLYARIDRANDASRCWRQAVRESVSRNDFLPAAKLLETKLNEPDEALRLLYEAWPGMDRSALCLAESFELLGRLGRHDKATQRVAKVMHDGAPPDRVALMVQTLSAVARLYPSSAVRERAADATRVIAGKRLALADRSETRALVQAVTRLAADDRLLARDGNRFMSKPAARVKPYPVAKAAAKGPTLIGTLSLQYVSAFEIIRVKNDVIFALGQTRNNRKSLIRANWSGQSQIVEVDLYAVENFYLIPDRQALQIIPIGPAGVINLEFRFDVNASFATAINISKPAWMPWSKVRSMDVGFGSSVLWLLEESNLASCQLPAGQLLRQTSLPKADWSRPIVRAAREAIYIADGVSLLEIKDEDVQLRILPRPVREMIVSPTGNEIAIVMDEGVKYVGGIEITICEGVVDPVAAYLHDGILLVVSRDSGRAFRRRNGKLECISTFAGLGATPVAVAPTIVAGEYAVFLMNGQIRTYRANF